MNQEEMQVWLRIRESNRAWMAGATHELASLFDEHAVVVKPDLTRIEGRDAIVKSYEEFIHHARTHSFEELEHAVDIAGDLAFVTYRFSVRYTLAGEDEEHEETGQEVLALRRAAQGWQVLWRTQVAT